MRVALMVTCINDAMFRPQARRSWRCCAGSASTWSSRTRRPVAPSRWWTPAVGGDDRLDVPVRSGPRLRAAGRSTPARIWRGGRWGIAPPSLLVGEALLVHHSLW